MRAVAADEILGSRKSCPARLIRTVHPKCVSGHTLNKFGRTTGSPRPSNSHFSLALPNAANAWTSSFLRPSHTVFRAVSHQICASTDTTVVNEDDSGLAEKTTWDLKGLKKETGRQVMRQWKRVSKADERVKREEAKIAELLAMDDPPMKAMEEVEDVDQMKVDLAEARERLTELNTLEEGLASIKSTGNPAFPELAQLAIKLGVNDSPPPKQSRGPKKQKQKPTAPRQPFLVYTSADGIQIRVGRGSSDNDKLSCDPQYRDAADWWMHAAGHAGSHVVIRSHDDDLPARFPETMKDAAALAAKNSKAPQRGKAGVSFVRCRQVSKPAGAKPGLVRLSG
eukprot:CAMPEP_0118945800 /NCGR_PEP_ID=MMETSP1169-20130426/42989_1 /TAXON_ID=36882 /ORGANISM="Pyramimonas obovata, Strain CCMP722" /LENGTH=338 /DNA_ID=CAMNT_0006891595 /DNA_START=137 /DNA_END=1150 /DNA_ORIENTATION=+